MLYYCFWTYPNVMLALGAIFTFLATLIGLHKFKDKLPADEGRDFAVDGKLSKGKPRGAGIIFVSACVLGTVLFSPIKIEHYIYILLVFEEMYTGYLDDKATKPWGRLKKGILDLFVALTVGVTYLVFNGSAFTMAVVDITVTIPPVLLVLLIAVMVWVSINVTNCADGVDGLSGTLVIITIISFYVSDLAFDRFYKFNYIMVFMMVAILAYLWFNAGPSILMMGDAGSRAMGVFISVVALKSGLPLLFIPFALLLILDGGLGLLKVSVIKIFKKKDFMKKIRTPLHDHVRKNVEVPWSNNQVVMRFAILQTIISLVTIYIFVR